ncbi:MAG TPA: hypothetical protein VIU93_02695 [Gallionellaceae bacterium]
MPFLRRRRGQDDFVAKSENISKAEAILMVGHHTVSGEPFPHARFKPGSLSAKVTEAAAPKPTAAAAPAPAAAAPPAPPETKPATSSAVAPPGGAEKEQMATFLEFRNITPSYQGAALLDREARMMFCDTEFASSAELAGTGETLAPILAHAEAAFAQWSMNAGAPAVLTLSAEGLAILVHKFGPADNFRLLVVRLANPAEVPVARRLIASVATKLA